MVYLWKEISETKNAQRNSKKCQIKVNMGNLKTKGARFVVRKHIQRNFHFLSENRGIYCSCNGVMKLFMCEVLVSVKHFYGPNLGKSRDRFLSGFILATKEVDKISSWQMIKELCLTIVIQSQPAKSLILVRSRDVDWNKKDGKFNMGKPSFLI